MSNDERAETQRLREANAVLMEAVEHYADKGNWRCSGCRKPSKHNAGTGCDERLFAYKRIGYDIAQAALDKHAAMQGETL